MVIDEKCKFHRIDGLHGHVHLQPHEAIINLNPPKIMVRRLQGDGIHDSDEMLSIRSWLDGLDLSYADENQVDGNPRV